MYSRPSRGNGYFFSSPPPPPSPLPACSGSIQRGVVESEPRNRLEKRTGRFMHALNAAALVIFSNPIAPSLVYISSRYHGGYEAPYIDRGVNEK